MPKKVSKKLKNKSNLKTKGKKAPKNTVDKDKLFKDALSSAILWENRAKASECSLTENKENIAKLLSENEKLHEDLVNTEHDTIEVIAYLKMESSGKDKQISTLNEFIKQLKSDLGRDKESLAQQHTQQLIVINDMLNNKDQELKVMQGELKQVKDFRRKRQQMQEEIDRCSKAKHEVEVYCRDAIKRNEQRCFEEKLRYHDEASRRMAELASNAHFEALQNLDETTRAIYEENVRVNKALQLHLCEVTELKKKESRLVKEVTDLRVEKEFNQLKIKENAKVLERNNNHIIKLKERISNLESLLNNLKVESAINIKAAYSTSEDRIESLNKEVETLKHSLKMKDKELKKVDRVSKAYLTQRSDLEIFFLDALYYVRNKIPSDKSHKSKSENNSFLPLLNQASSLDCQSTLNNSRDGDIRKDFIGLTWKQKEYVIEHLFAVLNKNKSAKSFITELP